MTLMLELLSELRKWPIASWVGATSLSKLADYLRGAQRGIEIAGQQAEPFVDEFREWVQAKFSPHYLGWEKLIMQQSTDDVDAVKRFWQLVDEFLEDRQQNDSLVVMALGGTAGVVE